MTALRFFPIRVGIDHILGQAAITIRQRKTWSQSTHCLVSWQEKYQIDTEYARHGKQLEHELGHRMQSNHNVGP